MIKSYQPMQAKLVGKNMSAKRIGRRIKTNSIRKLVYTTPKIYSFGQLEEASVPWGLEKFRFRLYRKNVIEATYHRALEALIKRRSKKHYSARRTKKKVDTVGTLRYCCTT